MNNSIIINRSFRIISLAWIILISVLLLSSCSNSPQPKDTKESAEDHNDAKFADNQGEKDAQYLVDAYCSGLYEIEASQQAKQKATRSDVKDLASQMIEEHARLNESLKALSAKKQVSLQQGLTEEQLKDIKEYDDKKGVKYDEAYISKVVEKHEKSIKLAEEAAEKASDTEIRSFFSNALPSLRRHLEMAMSLKDNLK
jgi:putative membrane protein